MFDAKLKKIYFYYFMLFGIKIKKKGSHRWQHREQSGEQEFHSANRDDYRDPMTIAAQSSGVTDIPEPVYVTIPRGGIAFHHQVFFFVFFLIGPAAGH